MWPTLNYICYLQHLYIFLYNENGLSLYNIFYLQHVYLFALQISQIFAFSYNFSWPLVNNFIILFSKLIISIACSLKDSQKFFMQLVPLYASYLFSVFKWWYCRHWKSWWNTFAYFCCGWIFTINLTSINLFY